MILDCSEYADLAAAHADGVLSAAEAVAADDHAAKCASCAHLRHQQEIARAAVRRGTRTAVAPASLRAAVGQQVAAAAEPPVANRRWMMVGAVAAGLLLALVPVLRPGHSGLIETLAADVAAAARVPALDLETDDPAELRGYYQRHGFTFANTVEDLEPAGMHLLGGSASEVGDAATTLTVYEKDGERVVCRRFRANAIDLPAGGRQVGGSEVFTRNGVSIALTRMGDIVCAMASAMPAEHFVSSLRLAHHH